MADLLEGPAGTARRVPSDRLAAILSGDTVASLELWWIHCPNTALLVAHAGSEPVDVAAVSALEVRPFPPGDALDTFALALITLADIPGVPPARRRWPWATHELLVQTVDTTPGPVPFDAPLPWRYMQPHNLSVQFQSADDDQARAVVEGAARAVVEGMLLPEIQAYVPERSKMMTLAPLLAVWQDTVDRLAEHHRTGGRHDEDPDR